MQREEYARIQQWSNHLSLYCTVLCSSEGQIPYGVCMVLLPNIISPILQATSPDEMDGVTINGRVPLFPVETTSVMAVTTLLHKK